MNRRARVLVVSLFAAGLLLGGTAAALTYVATPAPAAGPSTPGESRGADAGRGLQINLDLDVDAPVADLQPVTVRADPPTAASLPMPGASVERGLGVDRAGLGVLAGLGAATGSHTTRTSTQGATPVAPATSLAAVAVEPVAAAAAVFTLAGIVAAFWSSLKTWGVRLAVLPAVALYARVSRAEVFDNGVRERIFSAIRTTPGASASDLARAVNVSWGTTIYHLEVLEQTRMVVSLRKGRYRRYFENGAALTASKEAVAVLRNPVSAGVVETLRRSPGVTQKELAAAAQMSPQALHWHLVRLVEAGLVRKEREGRVVRHFVSS